MQKASKPLTVQFLRRALNDDDPWSIGNQALYDLCRRYPHHTTDSEIIAKIWLIGRAYAASIERGRGKAVDSGLSNDEFYTEAVPKALRASQLDEKLETLAKMKETKESNVGPVLDAHVHLVQLFHGLTNKSKRSLASEVLALSPAGSLLHLRLAGGAGHPVSWDTCSRARSASERRPRVRAVRRRRDRCPRICAFKTSTTIESAGT